MDQRLRWAMYTSVEKGTKYNRSAAFHCVSQLSRTLLHSDHLEPLPVLNALIHQLLSSIYLETSGDHEERLLQTVSEHIDC